MSDAAGAQRFSAVITRRRAARFRGPRCRVIPRRAGLGGSPTAPQVPQVRLFQAAAAG